MQDSVVLSPARLLQSAYPFIKISVQLGEDLTINVTRAFIIFAPLLADAQVIKVLGRL